MTNRPIWKFISSGPGSGSFNMERDEALAQERLRGGDTPVLRLYRWEPWSISLGLHQDRGEINEDQCKHDLIDVVQRPTGGRAILHAEELTYSVVMLAETGGDGKSGASVLDVYKLIAEALVCGLKHYGVDAELQRSQPAFSELYQSPASVTCFTSSARYEIEVNGRKLVGSAQRRYRRDSREVVLQHGSILTGPAHKTIVDYLRLEKAETRRRVARELESKTTDLATATGSPVNFRRLESCIKKGFEEALDITFGREVVSGTLQGIVHG